ncbi:peptidoglycan recognition family protein [Mycobacterium sp. 1274761.0]|uniref:peptidoglycan recognition protein family protein n=1 Tax=Mycobacterium sp. 1274761.0 TaxID=1834077 RepID=UPI000A99DF8E|nr:peptidoglycan recognition family protein [Mycobacterium sp. 1274761.0]
MKAPSPEGDAGHRGLLGRRRLLWLAGAGGLGAAAATLAPRWLDANSVAAAPAMPPAAPVPVPVQTPTAAAPSGVMLCRDAWGAKPPLPGGVTHKLSRMTLHHTGAVLGDNANAPGRLRQHQRLHQGERGWIDIAYHVGVDRNGNIYHLREPDLVGDTATEYNPTGHFLVLCEGDFDQEVATQEQVNSAALVFAWAAQRFNIPTDTLSGHKDFAATSCPGADLYAYLASGDLKRRVDDMVAAGPVSLQEICGEEAREKVAAIEAGQ